MTEPVAVSGIDVSIIVAVYNGMPYLEESLASLLGQTYDPQCYEVIAVDDGSTDDSLAVLRRYGETHPNLVVIPMEHTGSPAAPRNAGIDRARGRYLFFFDADDVLAPYALADMVAAADANDVDIVVPKQAALGARAVPIQAFRATLPSTDIFTADVYRILGPVKLFRTPFVRDNGFRFPAGMTRKSDVPFGVETYLAARRIAVLADRDYVHVRLRDDGGNLTTNRTKLSDHMPVVRFVFDAVAARVGEGHKRDKLMVRHFRTEMAKAVLEGFPGERDEEYRRACFDEFAAIAHRYCNPAVLRSLPVRERVVVFLIWKDRYATLCDIAPLLSETKQADVVTAGSTLYQAFPGFREPRFGVPDSTYRVHAGSCLQCSAVASAPSADDCILDFVARILVSNEPVDDVRLMLAPVGPGRTLVVFDTTAAHVTAADVRQVAFSVPASTLLAAVSGPASGEWGVELECSLDGGRLSVPVHYLESAKIPVDRWTADRAGASAGEATAARLARNGDGRLVVLMGTPRQVTDGYPRRIRGWVRMLRLRLGRLV